MTWNESMGYEGPAMLTMVTLVVRDYDEAIAFFVQVLGFALVCDRQVSPTKRWVVLDGGGGARLLLAKAATEQQGEAIGRQAGNRVGFFLHTGEFERRLGALRDAGVTIEGTVRHEPYGRVIVFHDIYGNRWDLIEPTRPEEHPPAVTG